MCATLLLFTGLFVATPIDALLIPKVDLWTGEWSDGLVRCTSNDKCPADKACNNGHCINPCEHLCGVNTYCITTEHNPFCACKEGYTGNPLLGCKKKGHVSCTSHDHCPNSKACKAGKCVDPCVSLCGQNTHCTTLQHIPACACKEGHTGNPLLGCTKQEAEVTTAIPSFLLTALSTTETPSRGCLLPNISDSTKFCSLDEDCEDCDFYNRRCHLPPGSRSSLVKVVCKPGYGLSQPSEYAICRSKGRWLPAITQCIKLCQPLKSNDLLLRCHYNNGLVPCSDPSLPGTWVSSECKPGYSEFPDLSRQGTYKKMIICNEFGEWSANLPPCKQECGVSNKSQKFRPLIVDGKPTQVGIFPWHAGLYYRKEENGTIYWDQICGGALITDRVVLTAAHCVAEKRERLWEISVALGKLHRSWDTQEPNEERFNVSDIVYPSEYNSNGYQFDIAMVLLSHKINKIGEYIMPVCRDNNERTRTAHLQKASREVHVVGWGRTDSWIGAPKSENLLHNTVTPLSKNQCKNLAPIAISSIDKFCAYKSNAVSIVQPGDSGGGVTAEYEDRLHYIVGIVSAKTNETSFFTNVTWAHHFDWIENQLKLFERNILL